MGEFSDEILEQTVPGLQAEYAAAEQGRLRELAEAEKQRLAWQTDHNRYQRLGSETVRLLRDKDIPILPVYSSDNGRAPLEQTGYGWHVLTKETHGGPAIPNALIALIDTGLIVQFHETTYNANGRHKDPVDGIYEGIVLPRKPLKGPDALKMIEGAEFKKGIASLILTDEPYFARRPRI